MKESVLSFIQSWIKCVIQSVHEVHKVKNNVLFVKLNDTWRWSLKSLSFFIFVNLLSSEIFTSPRFTVTLTDHLPRTVYHSLSSRFMTLLPKFGSDHKNILFCPLLATWFTCNINFSLKKLWIWLIPRDQFFPNKLFLLSC